jgi:type IV secretion system protein VirB11
MERILGPAPALPVALATPVATPAPVPRAGAPDTTPPKSSVTPEASAVESASNSALELNLRALRPILSDPEVTELCINRPGEAFVETVRGWERRELPFADFDWCRRLAKLIANSTLQRVDEATPLLSASLPTGERAQIVMPPATTAGTVAITLRRPSDEVWSIGELAQRGIFRTTRPLLRHAG